MVSTQGLWTLCLLISCLFIIQCASPQPLSGGPKDETPPTIIEAESTPNQQVHFNAKEITLTFDEWVVLKEIDKQLVTSPLFPKKPQIKLKGKSIIITLPDSLKDNTTYSMNFGSAIQDLNENNKLDNYTFVFSTGDFLDSVKLQGTVSDAITLKPMADVWVMLYAPGDDSLVFRQKPEYLSKSNAAGQWSISNIRHDEFRVVALKDENLNFIYDQEAELFGWLDTVIRTDHSATLPDIQVSPGDKREVIKEVNHLSPGRMKLVIPGRLPKKLPLFEPALEGTEYEWAGDTLHIWYSPDVNYTGRVILGQDTTRVRAADGATIKNSKPKILGLSGRIHPTATADLKSDIPVLRIDPSRIVLQKDTSKNIPFTITIDSLSKRILHLSASWTPPSRYTAKFQAGAITDIWGRASDSFNFSFVVNNLDQFSNLDLHVSGLDSMYQYVLQIKNGNLVERAFIIDHQSMTDIKTNGLQPAKYIIELIQDKNENGMWDTGDFIKGRQPEQKRMFYPDNLRAGWDVDFKIDWNATPVLPDKEKGKQ